MIFLSKFLKCLLQDEDLSGSRLHSFPGLYQMRSGTSRERFRSALELEGSRESRQDMLTRLTSGFPSY